MAAPRGHREPRAHRRGHGLDVGTYIYISREIPTFDSIADYHPAVASKVSTSDGSVIGQFYRERDGGGDGQHLRMLVQAVVSAEARIHEHPGLVRRRFGEGGGGGRGERPERLGASTMAQQVVKNFLSASEKKWKRKLKEIMLARAPRAQPLPGDILFLI